MNERQLNNLFNGIYNFYWTYREVSKEEASRSFDGLRDFMTHNLTKAFAIPAPVVGVIHPWQPVNPYGAKTDDDDESTQPLQDDRKPLVQALTEQGEWATNGLYYVYRTNLDTYHLHNGRVWQYCASNIEHDLQGELQDRYNECLRYDFARYSKLEYAELYDTTLPVWRKTESPFNG